MADGVTRGFVSGDGEQDEKRGDLSGGEALTVDLSGHQGGGQVIARVDAAVLGERGRVGADIERDLDELFIVGGEVRIPEAQNDIRPVEDLLVVVLRDAHHVADHLQRKRSGQFGDEFAVTVGIVGDQIRHQPLGARPYRFLGPGHHLRCEGTAHDVAQPGVARIVEGDHRTEVLGDLGGLIGDGDVGVGTEDVRVAAGVVDVLELHQRPVAGTCREALVADLVEESDRRLPPQGRERPVPDRVIQRPEFQSAQIDVRERHLRGSLAVHAGGDSPVCVTHA